MSRMWFELDIPKCNDIRDRPHLTLTKICQDNSGERGLGSGLHFVALSKSAIENS